MASMNLNLSSFRSWPVYLPSPPKLILNLTKVHRFKTMMAARSTATAAVRSLISFSPPLPRRESPLYRVVNRRGGRVLCNGGDDRDNEVRDPTEDVSTVRDAIVSQVRVNYRPMASRSANRIRCCFSRLGHAAEHWRTFYR